ncbi:glycosyltransferase family 2 protein [Paenibacillus spongiae]|uniref:Glycosyltransferase family 2 protein n=1 Tax=Paenibacillus spongiae TaxID=2909671 RepID=A0ABY5S5G3_9BACL|nr:glycosyltransferase family 2 protein [Paenibacillus spongiae]UVI28904.1 glycosyltransferase family 2 protein [Paenibacillus spongiae]
MSNERPTLGIVVPCYNEEAVIRETITQLSGVLKALMEEGLVSRASFLMFVNDGSRDRTWELIAESQKSNPLVSGLKLSGNVGHQNALLAGLMTAKEHADCVISIDADLQDDVKAIREFVIKYSVEGCEIVYGVRQSRKTDTFFKRTTAQGFYRFMERMGVKVTYNHADYRLMSKRALNELERFKEVNLFLRGIVPMIGFKTGIVFYDRLDRFAGESKYPLPKMLAFAFEGITSLSVRPIRLVTMMGFGLSLVSLAAVIYAVASKLLGNTVSGWTSLILSVWFLGGVQLLSLGLIGEYVGKIYKEVKRRPLYIVETLLMPDTLKQAEVESGPARVRSLNVQP